MHDRHQKFISNTAIGKLVEKKRWTLSINKKPIDIVDLIENVDRNTQNYQLKLAKYQNEQCMTSLQKIYNYLPNYESVTYFIYAEFDDLFVLDIEPTASKELKEDLLNTNFLYAEISMSGKGLHLIYDYREVFENYQHLQSKSVIQSRDKSFELLLKHYVTFTLNELDIKPNKNRKLLDNPIIKELLKNTQQPIEKGSVDIKIDDFTKSIDISDIKNGEEIFNILYNSVYGKIPKDFYDNMSSYEYGIVNFYLSKLIKYNQKCLELGDTSGVLNDDEMLRLAYKAIQSSPQVKFRPKHNTFRQGVPWLVYLIKDQLAKNNTKKNC